MLTDDVIALKRHGVKRLRIDEILGERSAVRALGKPIAVKKLDARGKVVREQSLQERKRVRKVLASGCRQKPAATKATTPAALDIWGEGKSSNVNIQTMLIS